MVRAFKEKPEEKKAEKQQLLPIRVLSHHDSATFERMGHRDNPEIVANCMRGSGNLEKAGNVDELNLAECPVLCAYYIKDLPKKKSL